MAEKRNRYCAISLFLLAFAAGLAIFVAVHHNEADDAVAVAAARGAISNRDNINLLARVIEGEAADEPFTGKVAVGAVILNRVGNSNFPNTLGGVVYQPLAFESVSNGQIWRKLTTESLRAAEYAFSGWDPTNGALFFWNPAKKVSAWIWSRKIVTQIGRHVFAF